MPPRRSGRHAAAAIATKNAPAKQEAVKQEPKRASISKPAKSIKKKNAKGKHVTKYGLAGAAAPSTNAAALGRVDPASDLDGSIFVDEHGTVHDVVLNLVDVAKNSDKYYILQLVECKDGKYVVFTRWGRTGMSGSCKMEELSISNALEQFAKMFEAKTGVEWDKRDQYTALPDKYEWAQMDHVQDQVLWNDNAKWQYWVDDGVDGKADGWYDYEPEGSSVVEHLFHEWSFNQHLCQRLVASGAWEYLVDLSALTQMNMTHPKHTRRHIRRRTAALGADQTPPVALQAATIAPPAAAAATPVKPRRGVGKRAAAASATALSTPPAKKGTAVIKSEGDTYAVDPACPLTGALVYEDYTATLNQTNVGSNNNKFYRLQLLTDSGGSFYVWTHWGRVGENGQSNLQGGGSKGSALDEEQAIQSFKKTFRAKTSNSWDERSSFVPKAGKYDLVELDENADDQALKLASLSPANVKLEAVAAPPCTLDAKTRDLVELIFNEDMFTDAMAAFDIDVRKMPLGNLSEAQVQKGYGALVELQRAIRSSNRSEVERLTGRFYTVIPHTFGRQRPPLIDTMEKLRAKFGMCDVLSDIETAQGLLKKAEDEASQLPTLAKHPFDSHYESLKTKLELVSSSDSEHAAITTYFQNTLGHKVQLKDVWRVDGQNEASNFKPFNKMSGHKLLWHGTNVAVVAAILSGGLRIMPHSGGRVGKGIYLASEHGKSAGYVQPSRKGGERIGVMFLVQAALGKMKAITRDDPSLERPPQGFDSVLAKGRVEPDPKKVVTVTLDGVAVSVPQGPPIPQADASDSSFYQSEYLVYKEAQQRLRYVLTFKW